MLSFLGAPLSSLAEALRVGNRSSARRDKAGSWDQEKGEKDPASFLPCDLEFGGVDEGSTEIQSSRGDCFLALDLASNEIGSKGARALLGAVREVPSMLFLSLRGNAALGSHHPEVLLMEQECAERRRALRSHRLGEQDRSAVLSVGRKGVDRLRNDDETARPVPNSGDVHGGREEMTPMKDRVRRGPADGDSTMATPSETSDDRGTIGRLLWVRESSPLAGKRPREGSLPMRGRYLGPLVDTCLDLVMLREPAADPNDPALYVNRVRTKLAESRAERLRRAKEDGATKKENLGATSSRTPFPKGAIVSPLAVEADRRHVLDERRHLISIDKYYAARKQVKLTSSGRIKVPRSKVLTQKHANAAFTRELMRRNGNGNDNDNGLGVGSKCPTTLRSHFLGLQNFQYDWGGVA